MVQTIYVVVLCWGCAPSGQQPRIDLSELLSSDQKGHAAATGKRQWQFPTDHGPHRRYRTEWWYLTGHVQTEAQKQFGIQFTIFRNSLAPPDGNVENKKNDWKSRQSFMGHMALSDISAQRFYHFSEIARPVSALAGAQSKPLRIWLGSWELSSASESKSKWQIKTTTKKFKYNLQLTPAKPLVLHGNKGLSKKGAGEKNASYYYSYPRLEARGSLKYAGQEHKVSGQFWFDHEFSTSVLTEEQIGWDWFSLQLSNGCELMLFKLRRRDNTLDPYNAATFVSSDGEATHLTAEQFVVDAKETWETPDEQVRYPIAWQIKVPDKELNLKVRAAFADQEWKDRMRYWEGSVKIQGSQSQQSVTGRGYAELTGYAR